MAARLKEKGYRFQLVMYGSGPMLYRTQELANRLGVKDVVTFYGNMPNEDILRAMRAHEIFLFTSDRNEGWGAVANEAMSCNCALVASDAIGSVPFLVQDGVNGCTFKSSRTSKGFGRVSDTFDREALDSLCEKVEGLLDSPSKRELIAQNGYKTLRDVWSPANAAQNLLNLINYLIGESQLRIKNGPCYMA